MRVAMGDNENIGLVDVVALRSDGEFTENVLVLPADEILADRLKDDGMWKKEVEIAECADDWDGEVNCRFPGGCRKSSSLLSEVAVVRLVPDPLRTLGGMSRLFGGSGGNASPFSELPHSLFLGVGCTVRRDFLLFSN